MTLIEFSVSYCCDELRKAMVKGGWVFEIDERNRDVVLLDKTDNEWTSSCPFCNEKIQNITNLKFLERQIVE